MSKIIIISLLIASLTCLSASDLCASLGQRCGHPQEGQTPCCTGYSCHWPETALPGSKGYCMPLAESLCASESETCGVPQEGHKSCCEGYECVVPQGLIGAPGKCQKQVLCAAHNERCGIPAEGGKLCCEGYLCDFDRTLIGAPGLCRTQEEITTKLNLLGKGLCAVRGENCGAPQEGQKLCCDGYHCARTSSALGAPGVCEPNGFLAVELLCASFGEKCGLSQEGQKACCEGYSCQWDSRAGLGAPGRCVAEEVNFNVCAQYNESCGAPQEGGKLCCEGYSCVLGHHAAIGAKGKCLPTA